jgi:SAM-dependent methyltransferase
LWCSSYFQRVADTDSRTQDFPAGFFDRSDSSNDGEFYRPQRLVTHIDGGAIAAIGSLYDELGLSANEASPVLDLMSSWISHFIQPPASLTILGMNQHELDANPMADRRVVHDLNANPVLPFDNDSFGAAVCCVSVDYLIRPFEVFDEVARVLRPGAPFVCTFSNRCFPTKAINGWLNMTDEGHCQLVATYFRRALSDDQQVFNEPVIQRRTEPQFRSDPLFAVWATTVS